MSPSPSQAGQFFCASVSLALKKEAACLTPLTIAHNTAPIAILDQSSDMASWSSLDGQYKVLSLSNDF